MDATEALFLGIPVVLSIVFGAQHFWDRYARRGLYMRTSRKAEELPAKIGLELRGAIASIEIPVPKLELDPIADKIRAALHDELQVAAQGLDAGIRALPVQLEGAVRAALPEIQIPDPRAQLDVLVQEIHTLNDQLAKVAIAAPAAVRVLEMKAKGELGGKTASAASLEQEVMERLGKDVLGVWGGLLEQYLPNVHAFVVENPALALEVLEWPRVKAVLARVQQTVGIVTGRAAPAESGRDPLALIFSGGAHE